MNEKDNIIQWLLQGDSSIRWQVQKDLLDVPENEYQPHRNKIATTGWGKQLLDHQTDDGMWGGGIYSPKWISTTYTLLVLKQLGLSPDNKQAKKAAKIFLDEGFYGDGGINFFGSLKHSETCVTGLVLGILCYFRINDRRIDDLAGFLFEQQLADGGWNCRSFLGEFHSSMHTTILALEGLREYEKYTPCQSSNVQSSCEMAIEFLLKHKLFKSDKTGKIIRPEFTRFSLPVTWRYDVMRVLDFMQEVNAPKDERFNDAIELLMKRKTKEGLWKFQNKYPGKYYFDLERVGEPSRWNTLRAIRILNWWNS